jgi:tetratricopeptide (TPR) repeat protein
MQMKEREASAPSEETLSVFEEALRAGVLRGEKGGRASSCGANFSAVYSFWHPLLIEHLYDTISKGRRPYEHRCVADMLRTLYEDRVEEAAHITYHLMKSGADQALIVVYALRAASHAHRLSCYLDAEHFYRLALAAPFEEGTSPNRATLLEYHAECLRILGRFQEARQAFEQAYALRLHARMNGRGDKGDLQIKALLLCEIGVAYHDEGFPHHAHNYYQQSEHLLKETGVVSGPPSAIFAISRVIRSGCKVTRKRHTSTPLRHIAALNNSGRNSSAV